MVIFLKGFCLPKRIAIFGTLLFVSTRERFIFAVRIAGISIWIVLIVFWGVECFLFGWMGSFFLTVLLF